jgi:hypothetical protein
MIYRLYLVNRITGKCTGTKRDYPSHVHLIKYAGETFERYDSEYSLFNELTNTRAKLCTLNARNKWEEISQEQLDKIKEEWKLN